MTTTDNVFNREQIKAAYKLSGSSITSPGKFEGEPIYAPAYWSLALDGLADEETHDGYVFKLGGNDFEQWPELAEQGYKHGDELHLRESEQGFVYCN